MKTNLKRLHCEKTIIIGSFLRLTILTLLITTIYSIPRASAHEITFYTNSRISNGQVNPSPIIEGVGFAHGNNKFDFTVDMSTTKLEFDSTAYIDSSHMRFNFHGVAFEGTITITAEATAFEPDAGHSSNAIEIIVVAPLRSQTISFVDITQMTVGDKDQTVVISSNSKLNVTLTSNTPSTCTIDFGKIHAVAAGICSVVASQPGDSIYAAAPAVTKTLEVLANSKSELTVPQQTDEATNLGSALYDPEIKEGGYASVLVAGSKGGRENAKLVKLLIPPQATTAKTVFLISALSSDEETAEGYFVARISAVMADGTSIRKFKKPIEINIPSGPKDALPYWSFDQNSWHRLPRIESESLPASLHAAYFVEADGRIAILSDYLMLFGLRKEQAQLNIISPVRQLSPLTTAAFKSHGGSGDGVVNYKSFTELICSITPVGVVTALNEGQCLIGASKESSGNFADARSNQVSIEVKESTRLESAIPTTLNTGYLTHSLTFMQKNNTHTLDVGLCSIYANEKADFNVGTKGKNGSWNWKLVSSTQLDENGFGVFTLISKILPGQRVRISVNSVIQMESDM